MVYRKASLIAASFCVFFLPLGVAAQNWSSKGPIDRNSHSAVFDPTTNRMVVFGGRAYSASRANLNDLWRLNAATNASVGSTWTAVAPLGSKPSARSGHTAVYNSISNRMIVFGGGLGSTSPCVNDTWVLENANGNGGTATWAQLSPSGATPPARLYHSAVYDATSNVMMMYGGGDCFSTVFGDFWILSNADGTGGTPTWTQLTPTGVPPTPRAYHTSVYDSSTNSMIVFGGSGFGSILFNDVWVLSHANGNGGTPAWTQLTPSGAPPAARTQHSAVYNPVQNTMTIFAGSNSVLLNDTWVLSNANGSGSTPAWKQIGTGSTLPAVRYGHTAIYNSTTNIMTVFGGVLNLGETIDANDVFFVTHANGH